MYHGVFLEVYGNVLPRGVVSLCFAMPPVNPSSHVLSLMLCFAQSIYPTDQFKSNYTTPMPFIFAVVVAATFALVALIFFGYDWVVQKRNKELATHAARSKKLVSTLFPGEIGDQLLEQQDIGSKKTPEDSSDSALDKTNASPLAKFYPQTTILFADLVGMYF